MQPATTAFRPSPIFVPVADAARDQPPENETISLAVTVDPMRFKVDLRGGTCRITLPLDAPVMGCCRLRASGEIADWLVSASGGAVRQLSIDAILAPEDDSCLDIISLHACDDLPPTAAALEHKAVFLDAQQLPLATMSERYLASLRQVLEGGL